MTICDIKDVISWTLNAGTLIVTTAMAYYTFRLAKQTSESISQTDRHHLDGLRPFCVLEFSMSSKDKPFGEKFYTDTSDSIIIEGVLFNKGHGLAKDVMIYLNMRRGKDDSDVFRLTSPVLVTGLIGAGERMPVQLSINENNIRDVWMDGQWVKMQPNIFWIASDTYEVVIEYRDVYDNIFRTVHPRGTFRSPYPDPGNKKELLDQMWIPNMPSPGFLSGRQEDDGNMPKFNMQNPSSEVPTSLF